MVASDKGQLYEELLLSFTNTEYVRDRQNANRMIILDSVTDISNTNLSQEYVESTNPYIYLRYIEF